MFKVPSASASDFSKVNLPYKALYHDKCPSLKENKDIIVLECRKRYIYMQPQCNNTLKYNVSVNKTKKYGFTVNRKH